MWRTRCRVSTWPSSVVRNSDDDMDGHAGEPREGVAVPGETWDHINGTSPAVSNEPVCTFSMDQQRPLI